jgi:hypothetical protein
MNETFGPVAFLIGFLAFWFVLNKWVFPKFGIRT